MNPDFRGPRIFAADRLIAQGSGKMTTTANELAYQASPPEDRVAGRRPTYRTPRSRFCPTDRMVL
jgi:hypothetical protein